MFFLMDFVYSALIAVKGNLKGLITGKYPREYLEQLAPDILSDIEKREGKVKWQLFQEVKTSALFQQFIKLIQKK